MLTFTQNISLQPGTAFSHAWSLCIEEQFYVLLPALALLIAASRHSLRWTLAALVLAVGGGMAARFYLLQEFGAGGNDYFKFIYYSSICRLDELIAGVVLALLKNYHAALWTRLTAHGNAVLALGCALTALTFYLFLQDRYGVGMTVFGYPLLALSFALLILAALSEKSVLRSARVPGAASIALWSYAIYLTHKQLLILARDPLANLGYGPESALALAAMVVISVGSGWILYRVVERPFMALRARYVPANFA